MKQYAGTTAKLSNPGVKACAGMAYSREPDCVAAIQKQSIPACPPTPSRGESFLRNRGENKKRNGGETIARNLQRIHGSIKTTLETRFSIMA